MLETEEQSDAEVIDEQALDPRPLKLHILRAVPMVLVLGLLIHFLLPRLGSIETSIETMRSMAPALIALALAAEALSYVANGALLQAVVCLAGERITLRRAAAIEIGAGTIAIVAAGALGFGAAIYRWTRKGGVTPHTAVLASWLPSVFDSATLVLFGVVGAAELLFVHHLSRPTMIALATVLFVLVSGIVAVVVLFARNDWMMAVAVRSSKLMKRIIPRANEAALIDAAGRAEHTWIMLKRGGWTRPVVSSFLVLALDSLCLYFAFRATGQHISLPLLLAGYGVPLLLGRASFLPGGIAVVEVAMAALFGALGVPASAAVVAVLTYRLISFWLPAIVGIPIAIGLQSRRRSPSVIAH